MIKAVLLDLDNTLIHNPDRQFAHAFSQAWNDHLKNTLNLVDATGILRACIEEFGQAGIHSKPNYTDIVETLSDQANLPVAQVQDCLRSFFLGSDYNKLVSYVTPLQGANELVKSLLANDIAVVISTNPIYPLDAILKRLDKGGLPTDNYAFISSAENMHYAKPNPAYFAEILGRVGIEPDEALVVGDSITNDIVPANLLGIKTVYTGKKQPNSADFNCSITNIITLLSDTNWQTPITRENLSSKMIIPQYEGNVGALYGLLDQTIPAFWNQHPDPDEWSILQILCHLYTAENDIQRARLITISEQDAPFITAPLSPGRDIPVCHDNAFTIADMFVQSRQKTINFLDNLAPEDWYRPARHSIFGITNLLEMAHFTAQHDRLHLNQLCQTIGKCD